MSDAQRSWPGDDPFSQRRPMRSSSARTGGGARFPSLRAMPDTVRRALLIGVGLTGSVLLAATIIWGISRMGPRSVPLIEADGRPFRVRPDTQIATPAVATLPERGASRQEQARLAPAPEAPRTEALRQQMQPPAPAPAPAAASPATPNPATPSQTAAATQPAPARAAVAPRTATPAPATAPPAAQAGRTQVQLSAATSEEAARGEWERLRRRVPELASRQPRITRFERDGQSPLWRLRVGGLADAAAARALCEQVRARGGACMPV